MPRFSILVAALLLLKVQTGFAASSEMIQIGQSVAVSQSDGNWAIPFEFERPDENSLDLWMRLLSRKDAFEPLTQFGSEGAVMSVQLINKMGLAAGFGWLLGRKVDLESMMQKWDGIRVEAKVGLGGGQVGLGLKDRVWAVFFPIDYDLKATYLLNWNGLQVEGSALDSNYFGMEADFSVLFSRLSLGLYRSTGASSVSTPGAWAGIVSWGI